MHQQPMVVIYIKAPYYGDRYVSVQTTLGMVLTDSPDMEQGDYKLLWQGVLLSLSEGVYQSGHRLEAYDVGIDHLFVFYHSGQIDRLCYNHVLIFPHDYINSDAIPSGVFALLIIPQTEFAQLLADPCAFGENFKQHLRGDKACHIFGFGALHAIFQKKKSK